MKHIFMGKILHIEYQFIGKNYDNLFWDDIKSIIEDENNLLHNNYDCVYINESIKEQEWGELSTTDLIKETLDLEKYVLINNEELIIEKIVQKDNGDVIVYLDKIIDRIENEESKKETEKLFNIFKEKQNLVNKKEREKLLKELNKKWWEFWK